MSYKYGTHTHRQELQQCSVENIQRGQNLGVETVWVLRCQGRGGRLGRECYLHKANNTFTNNPTAFCQSYIMPIIHFQTTQLHFANHMYIMPMIHSQTIQLHFANNTLCQWYIHKHSNCMLPLVQVYSQILHKWNFLVQMHLLSFWHHIVADSVSLLYTEDDNCY